MFTYNGETKTYVEWAKSIGITASGLKSRLKEGISLDEVMTRPVGKMTKPAKITTAARNEIVNKNLRLALYFSHHLREKYPRFADDLIQSAYLGVIRAAELWDVSQGKFSFYAGKWAKSFMQTELIRMAYPMVVNHEEFKQGNIHISCTSNFHGVAGATPAEDLSEYFCLLPKVQVSIIYMIYYENRTHKEVGKILGLNRKTVGAYHKEAISNLREVMLSNDMDL